MRGAQRRASEPKGSRAKMIFCKKKKMTSLKIAFHCFARMFGLKFNPSLSLLVCFFSPCLLLSCLNSLYSLLSALYSPRSTLIQNSHCLSVCVSVSHMRAHLTHPCKRSRSKKHFTRTLTTMRLMHMLQCFQSYRCYDQRKKLEQSENIVRCWKEIS